MISILLLTSAMMENYTFSNSPMEVAVIHKTGKYPIFGTEEPMDVIEKLGTPPSAQDPTQPMHGFYKDVPQEWLAHHKAILRDAPTQKWNIVFLGDSITQGWLGTKEWNTWLKPRGAFNMGIGGDRTSQLLWRIEHGELEHLQPRLVVLMIGTNNLWQDTDTFGVDAVAQGTKLVVEAIRKKLPNAKILQLDIPPILREIDEPVRQKVIQINKLTQSIADEKSIYRLNVGHLLVDEQGRIDPSIMSDFVHPTPLGYARLSTEVLPKIEELLKE